MDSGGGEEMKSDVLDFDEAVEKYGNGRYQYVIVGLVMLTVVPPSIHNSGYVFIGANQDHVCKAPSGGLRDRLVGANKLKMVNFSDIQYETDTCSYSAVTYINGSKHVIESGVVCSEWVYDTTYFQSTIVSEWNLNSCQGQGQWLISLATSIYMLGFLIGCFLLSAVADRYGRLLTVSLSAILMVLTGVAAAFSVNIEMLIVCRFLLGIATAGCNNAGSTYVLEVTKYRGEAGLLAGSVYAVGGILVTGIAQLLPDWRHFQLACALACVAYIPLYWILPESPRWQLNKGLSQKALQYFKRSAKINRVAMISDFSFNKTQPSLKESMDPEKSHQGSTLVSALKLPHMRAVTAVVCLMWFTSASITFGLLYNIGNLAGNIFINNYLLWSAGILPGLCWKILTWGRKPMIVGSFISTGVLTATILVFAEKGIEIGVVVLVLAAYSVIIFILNTCYVVTPELFPTSIRASATGLGSAAARIGGIVSPYIVQTSVIWSSAPYVVFSIMAFITGMLALLLPETKSRKLPDTIEEAEKVNKIGIRCQRKQSADAITASSGSTISVIDLPAVEEVKVSDMA